MEETGTAFSYIINNLVDPSIDDLMSIASDFMSRISDADKELLRKAICYEIKTEAEMQCYAYDFLKTTARDIMYAVVDVEEMMCGSGGDVAIVDHNSLGLSVVAFIEGYCRKENYSVEKCRRKCTSSIKEVILIEENEICLQRAVLLISKFLPDCKIRTVCKNNEDSDTKGINCEHMVVYHLPGKKIKDGKAFHGVWGYLHNVVIANNPHAKKPCRINSLYYLCRHGVEVRHYNDYTDIVNEPINRSSVSCFEPYKKKNYLDSFLKFPLRLSPVLEPLSLEREIENDPSARDGLKNLNKYKDRLYDYSKQWPVLVSNRVLFNLALCFENIGSRAQANELYKIIIARDDHFDMIVSKRARYNSASIELERGDDIGFANASKVLQRYVYDCDPYDVKTVELISVLANTNCDEYGVYHNLSRLYEKGDSSPLCAFNYAICLAEGIGCVKNAESATSILKNVLDMDIDDKFKSVVCRRIGNIYHEEDEARAWWQKSLSYCSKEEDMCAPRLNIALTLREENPEKALTLFLQCIEHGCKTCGETDKYNGDKRHCPKALNLAASMYANGRGVDKDANKAEMYYKEAIEQGWSCAATNLADCYRLKIIENADNDAEKIVSLYELDEENAHKPKTQYIMGCLLERKNPTKALHYLLLAAVDRYIPAEKELIKFIPRIPTYSVILTDMLGFWYVQSVLDGVNENLEMARRTLCELGERYIEKGLYEDAEKCYNYLAKIDESLSKEKLAYLDRVTPDAYKDMIAFNEERRRDWEEECAQEYYKECRADAWEGDMPGDYDLVGRG